MSFDVGERCLERLEWPEVTARLARHGQTPRGARRLAEGPWFARTLDEARSLLAGTREARSLLAEGDVAPLGGVREIEELLGRLRKDGLLTGSELLAIGATARACAETRSFLLRRREEAPGLAAEAEALPELADLASSVDAALESDGAVRDAASPALAAARREANEMAGRAQERIVRPAALRGLQDLGVGHGEDRAEAVSLPPHVERELRLLALRRAEADPALRDGVRVERQVLTGQVLHAGDGMFSDRGNPIGIPIRGRSATSRSWTR